MLTLLMHRIKYIAEMTEATPPEEVREFAKSFQALLNVVSPGVSGHIGEQMEEMKSAAEVSTHRMLESARALEHYFSTKYFLFSTFFPEEVLKEEIAEMKSESERKEALIMKHQEKLQQWQQQMGLNLTPSIISLDNSKP